MTDVSEAAATLASALASADQIDALLPSTLPCPPLELLVALHNEVRHSMLSDIPRAGRAALAARRIAARHLDEPFIQAQARWTSGNAVIYVPDYPAALAHYDAALGFYTFGLARGRVQELPPDVRAAHINRVFCLSELGLYAEAQQAVAAAQEWLANNPNPYAELTLLLNRSLLAGAMGDNSQVVTLADETIALALELGYPDRAAQAWVNRANACTFLGRYAEAEIAIDNALELAALVGDPLTAARARVARATVLHTRGSLFTALAELRVAAQGFAQAPGERSTLLLEEAVISAQLQQWDEALAAALAAARLFGEQRLPTYSAESALLAARIAAQRGKASRAHELLALARAQLPGDRHPFLGPEADLTAALAATLDVPGATAAKLLRTRRTALSRAGEAIERLRRAGLEHAVAEGMLIQATLEAQLGHTDRAVARYRSLRDSPSPAVRLAATGALGSLLPATEALPVLEEAAQLAVEQRRTLPMEEIQARYSAETAPYHIRLAQCALALGAVERAAAAIWEAKAGPILDLRAAGAADSSADMRVTALKADLSRLRRRRDEHHRNARVALEDGMHQRMAFHQEAATRVSAELDQCASDLTAYLRILGDRAGQRPVPSLAEVQRALGPATALLEWFEADGMLFAMLVTSCRPPVVRRVAKSLEVAVLLDRWSIIAHRHRIAAQPTSAKPLAQALAPLAGLLLEPWRADLDGLSSLLVAPVGLLFQVPWAALAALWNADISVILTPSGGLWAAPPEPAATPPGPARALGYAGDGEDRLTHVEAELASIVRHLPETQLYHQAQAANLRAGPPPVVLHIGSHARTHPAAPLCSTIELADGPFLLYEAHRLNLRGTTLVVLSACETSMRPDHGDIALALAGAFLCAGAGAVVASLWAVNDAATSALMGHFYANLGVGYSPTEALRQASAAIREHYPLDWAAFQLWAGDRVAAAEPLPLARSPGRVP